MRGLSILLVFVWLLGLAACSTKVDLNAPYQERPVIYAVLEAGGKQQFVRVEKSFLTINNPSADSIAGIKDSIYYAQETLQVTLSVFNKGSGQLSQTLALKPVVTTDKDTGLFYGPDQILYATDSGLFLDPTKLYLVRVKNVRTGVQVDAVTNIMPIVTPTDFIVPKLDTGGLKFKAVSPLIEFDSHLHDSLGKMRIDVTLPIQETLVDGGTRIKTIEWAFYPEGEPHFVSPTNQPTWVGNNSFPNTTYLYDLLRLNLDTTDLNVLSRKVLTIPVRVVTANTKLSNYIDFNRNYNVLTQTTPFYTNVNGGLGVVGSRFDKTFSFKMEPGFYNTAAIKYKALKFHQ